MPQWEAAAQPARPSQLSATQLSSGQRSSGQHSSGQRMRRLGGADRPTWPEGR